ncbi:hypothetical protein EOM89_13485, partial [Candidatus Falkowbacteria bacterium]|nr:hypothetical protein [Candidatus Falkowbacteria bacterium]
MPGQAAPKPPSQQAQPGYVQAAQQQLGCRWFTPSVSVIPDSTTVQIDATLDYSQKPVFEYRYQDWNCTLDENWRVKQVAFREGLNEIDARKLIREETERREYL